MPFLFIALFLLSAAAHAEVFWSREQGRREVVKAQRSSANVPDSLALFSTGAYLFDLYADEVELLGQVFPGPTHPQTFKFYRFQLVGQEHGLYHIAVWPRSDVQPGFSGSLAVSASDYALVEARLRPNRRLRHKYLEAATGLGYLLEQRFARVEPGVWLPLELITRSKACWALRPKSNRSIGCAAWRRRGRSSKARSLLSVAR
jgi:hypothetical protein